MSDALSFNAAIAELGPGETHARAARHPFNTTSAGEVNRHLSKLRQTVNAAVSRARQATGFEFKVESGQYVANDGEAIISCVAITRTDEEDGI